MDGAGRRLGYSTATGALTEIPGSMWFGEADGIGWIFGAIQAPLSIQLSGLGGPYYVMVDAESPTFRGGLVLSGELGLGETLSTEIPLQPVNQISVFLPIIISD